MATREELDQAVLRHERQAVLDKHKFIATAYRELQGAIKEMVICDKKSSYNKNCMIGWLLRRRGLSELETESLVIDSYCSSAIVKIKG